MLCKFNVEIDISLLGQCTENKVFWNCANFDFDFIGPDSCKVNCADSSAGVGKQEFYVTYYHYESFGNQEVYVIYYYCESFGIQEVYVTYYHYESVGNQEVYVTYYCEALVIKKSM